MKKVGILTFHNSYNCGSMLESYAIQNVIKNLNMECEIIDFSNDGQRLLYSPLYRCSNIKNILRNIMIFPGLRRIIRNNKKYEEFKKTNFNLSEKQFHNADQLDDKNYAAIVAGSDQIWNITLEDGDDAYFLPWVKNAKKIAYAPSFGAKNILKYSKDIEKYKNYLRDFDSLSIREYNGKKWIKDLINKEVDVLLDPTLLLNSSDYEKIEFKDNKINNKYIFFYCPSFNSKICEFVKKVAEKYNLNVYVWSTKSYYIKRVWKYGFKLPLFENPSMYLNMIKNAELVITTSYHGTIFSTIYRKKFLTIKNGEMYGDDDRVITLLDQMNMKDRLFSFNFDDSVDYLAPVDYTSYENNIKKLQEKSIEYLKMNIGVNHNENRK